MKFWLILFLNVKLLKLNISFRYFEFDYFVFRILQCLHFGFGVLYGFRIWFAFLTWRWWAAEPVEYFPCRRSVHRPACWCYFQWGSVGAVWRPVAGRPGVSRGVESPDRDRRSGRWRKLEKPSWKKGQESQCVSKKRNTRKILLAVTRYCRFYIPPVSNVPFIIMIG